MNKTNQEYKTPKSAIYSTLNSIREMTSQIDRLVKRGMFAEAASQKDELENSISTLGEQIETHLE